MRSTGVIGDDFRRLPDPAPAAAPNAAPKGQLKIFTESQRRSNSQAAIAGIATAITSPYMEKAS
jgi:hypothetical protein